MPNEVVEPMPTTAAAKVGMSQAGGTRKPKNIFSRDDLCLEQPVRWIPRSKPRSSGSVIGFGNLAYGINQEIPEEDQFMQGEFLQTTS